MGFFTSRKADNTDIHLAVTSTTLDGEKSVVNAIRSRFISKGKGKEREESAPKFAQSVSVAETLSGALPTTTRSKQPSFASKSSSISLRAGPSSTSLKSSSRELNNPTTPHRKAKNPASPTAAPTTSSPSPRPSLDSRNVVPPARPRTNQPSSTYSRNSITTDSATSTLAQRLNELASANAQGLLDDEEYRVLRQNLFERFASNAVVPTEVPVVPVTSPQSRRPDIQGQNVSRPVSRPLSNFQVDKERPPSVASRNSGTFSVSSFMKRATSNRRTGGGSSKDYSETSSVFSTTSKSSTNFFRRVTRKSSNGSVRTTTSRGQADTMSISSRQTALESDRGQSDRAGSVYPSTPRSTSSARRFQTPPSSFNHRILETRHLPHASDVFDEDHAKSASELRQEILAVEAEARRLMDAFNGLEVTTLAKLQRQHGHVPPEEPGAHLEASSSAGHYDGRSVIRLDPDALSIRSGTSIGTSHSMKHVGSSARKPRTKGSLNPSISLGSTGTGPGSLRRKDSSSSFGSQERLAPALWNKNLPPLPALPAAYGHLKLGSASNLSLSRSAGHLPMTSVPEDNSLTMADSPVDSPTNEMEDIRRRRVEVSRRYDARLEYLRARLKGAELHEKLARK